ncbi:MAG: DUF5652 family protein [Patescibacteria group bacterium]
MEQFILDNSWVLVLLALWSVPWKGWALWKAVKNDDRAWFIVLLIVNTLAILEIFYIFIFSKRKVAKNG